MVLGGKIINHFERGGWELRGPKPGRKKKATDEPSTTEKHPPTGAQEVDAAEATKTRVTTSEKGQSDKTNGVIELACFCEWRRATGDSGVVRKRVQ